MELTSHTINESVEAPSHLFENILQKVKDGINWIRVYDSFESYYYMIHQAIKYFESKEDYESCALLRKNIKMWIDKIPTDMDGAIKFLIESTPKTHSFVFSVKKTFSLALSLHRSTGAMIIDLWLLRYDESPLKQYFVNKHNIDDADEIANKILIAYIDAYKSKLEAE